MIATNYDYSYHYYDYYYNYEYIYYKECINEIEMNKWNLKRKDAFCHVFYFHIFNFKQEWP